jgi:hypothetical protein
MDEEALVRAGNDAARNAGWLHPGVIATRGLRLYPPSHAVLPCRQSRGYATPGQSSIGLWCQVRDEAMPSNPDAATGIEPVYRLCRPFVTVSPLADIARELRFLSRMVPILLTCRRLCSALLAVAWRIGVKPFGQSPPDIGRSTGPMLWLATCS